MRHRNKQPINRSRSGIAFALLLSLSALTGCTSSSDTNGKTAPTEAAPTLANAQDTALDDAELTFDSAAEPIPTEVKLVKPGVLTACIAKPFPPFTFSKQSDGEDTSGIDVDIITALASGNRLTPEFVETPFDQTFDALAGGKCDVIASAVPITEAARKRADFTEPYFTSRQSLLVRAADSGTYRSLNDLVGKTVGIQVASIASERIAAEAKAAGVLVKEYEGRFEMLEHVRNKTIDGIVSESATNGYDAKESDYNLRVTSILQGDEEQYGFAVAKSNGLLTSELNRSLTRLRDRRLLRRIVIRYIGSDAAG